MSKKSKKDSKVGVSRAITYLSDKNTRSPLSNFKLLRSVAALNSIVQVVKDTLKHQVVSLDYSISTRRGKDIDQYKGEVDYLYDLFDFPNSQQTFREFWLQVLEDILVIDRGAIESVYNAKGEIVEFYQVDGATIRPRVNGQGEYLDPAFIQAVSDKVVAEFEENEISLLVNNPRSEIDSFGYGRSPVEKTMLAVVAGINAEKFNTEEFTESSLPPFAVNIPNAQTQEELDAFAQNWESRTEGNMWKALFFNDEDGISIQKLRESNQDMQYYELTLWMAKITIAAFEISPQDVGLTMDINRSTGDSQWQLTKTQGLKSMMVLIEEWHNKQIRKLAQKNLRFRDLKFHFNEIDKLDEKTQAEIDEIYLRSGVYTPAYIQKEKGIEVDEESQQIEDNVEEFEGTEEIQSNRVNDEHFIIKNNNKDLHEQIAQEVDNILYG